MSCHHAHALLTRHRPVTFCSTWHPRGTASGTPGPLGVSPRLLRCPPMACPPLSSHQYLRLPLLHCPLQWPVQGPACASALPIPVPRWPSVLAAPPGPPCSRIPHCAVLSHSSTSLPHVQALPRLTLLRPAQTPRRWGPGDVLGNLCPRADCVACGCTVQQPPAASCLPTSWALSPAPGSWWPIILVLPPFCPHPSASPTPQQLHCHLAEHGGPLQVPTAPLDVGT